jgi:hypothetical protein
MQSVVETKTRTKNCRVSKWKYHIIIIIIICAFYVIDSCNFMLDSFILVQSLLTNSFIQSFDIKNIWNEISFRNIFVFNSHFLCFFPTNRTGFDKACQVVYLISTDKTDSLMKFRLFCCSLLGQLFFSLRISPLIINLVFQLRWELHWLLVVLPTQIVLMGLFICLMVISNKWIDFNLSSSYWNCRNLIATLIFRNYWNANIQFIWLQSTKPLTVSIFNSVIQVGCF